MSEKIMSGVRVVELSTYIAGPTCARILGDWGADVIKVEGVRGDPIRKLGANMFAPIDIEENPVFFFPNANKRIIALDQRKPEGGEIMQKLVAETDVFVTNFRNDALQAMGLDYETLKAKNPGIIFAHVLGYGSEGPEHDRPAFDFTTYFARSGLMNELADSTGFPTVGIPGLGDHQLAMYMAGGIAAALFNRTRTGLGDYVNVSLYHVGIYGFATPIATVNYAPMYPMTRTNPGSPLTNSYKCADGEWFYLGTPDYITYWPRITRAIGLDEYAENPDYCSILGMLERREEIREMFDKVFATKTSLEWDQIMRDADIPAERLYHFGDIVKDEQAIVNNFIQTIEYENGNSGQLPTTPVKFGSLGLPEYKLPGAVGCDTVDILDQLGYDSGTIERLKEGKVVAG